MREMFFLIFAGTLSANGFGAIFNISAEGFIRWIRTEKSERRDKEWRWMGNASWVMSSGRLEGKFMLSFARAANLTVRLMHFLENWWCHWKCSWVGEFVDSSTDCSLRTQEKNWLRWNLSLCFGDYRMTIPIIEQQLDSRLSYLKVDRWYHFAVVSNSTWRFPLKFPSNPPQRSSPCPILTPD